MSQFLIMFKPLEIFIGLRYTRAKRHNHFISFISLISMLGIALGVLVLITVLSVMNGFEKEIRERILGFASHATISGLGQRLENWQEVAEQARLNPKVVGVAPYVEGQAMLALGQAISGVQVRGVDPEEEPKVSELDEKMKVGSMENLQAGEFGIILGRELADKLGAFPGDKITMVTPQAQVTPAGVLPRLKRFTLVGIFEVGMNQYDSGLAVIHIRDAARLWRLGDDVVGVRLKLEDLFEARQVSRAMAHQLPGVYLVSDWTRQHANFFSALQMEKRMLFLILLLIVAVAAFNIVSTLVMVVTDKQADIAILRTLGIAPGGIMWVFIVQGTLIGVVGTLLGTAGGVALSLNLDTVVPFLERAMGMELFPQDIYYINTLPSDLHWDDVTLISSLAFILTLAATLYPAWRASRTQPAEALRYE